MRVNAAKPVFLDRDGTIIVEKGYLSDPDQVCFETGAVEGLAALAAGGHPLVVLTNQSGIGRGYYGESDARRVNARLAAMLREHDIEVSGWYLCPHAPEAACDCRKPLPGMALAASKDLNLELADSWVIGDSRGDVLLADGVGATGILVTTGHGAEWVDWARLHSRPVYDDLRGAAAHVLGATRP